MLVDKRTRSRVVARPPGGSEEAGRWIMVELSLRKLKVLVVIVYLQTSIGATGLNLRILGTIGEELAVRPPSHSGGGLEHDPG